MKAIFNLAANLKNESMFWVYAWSLLIFTLIITHEKKFKKAFMFVNMFADINI